MSDIVSHMSSIPEDRWEKINWKDNSPTDYKDIVSIKVTATVIDGFGTEIDIQETKK